jgi:ABC-type multidrug transport system fused ATPase/permease subunit
LPNFVLKNGDLVFDNVHFSYDKRKIFDGLNLKIKGGQRAAIVGQSGTL